MKALGSPAAVIAAVRDDAEAEVERLEREAEAALARLAAEDGAAREPLPDREPRLASARREARERLAREDLLDAREALEAREAWLALAVAEGTRLLDEPVAAAERRRELAVLAREALERLRRDPVEVLVAPSDAGLLDAAWARELAPDRQVHVVARPGLSPGGCIVQREGGKVAFDNTREARARRFEAAWRTALGALYRGAEEDA